MSSLCLKVLWHLMVLGHCGVYDVHRNRSVLLKCVQLLNITNVFLLNRHDVLAVIMAVHAGTLECEQCFRSGKVIFRPVDCFAVCGDFENDQLESLKISCYKVITSMNITLLNEVIYDVWCVPYGCVKEDEDEILYVVLYVTVNIWTGMIAWKM